MTRIDVINFLISKYNFKKYLEIGVRRPQDCFSHIICEHKDGVDPGLENVSNPVKYPYTSDEFFFKLDSGYLDIPSVFKYDIIFIDGLHISHQVEKDILNSLNHLTPNGIIILHDCNPFMYGYNYLRVIEDYFGQSWNGTVWKAIYKLKATRTDLKIGTLNLDEGLGIITRGYQELIPFDNPYFEYRKFTEDLKRNLGLMEFDGLESWLNMGSIY